MAAAGPRLLPAHGCRRPTTAEGGGTGFILNHRQDIRGPDAFGGSGFHTGLHLLPLRVEAHSAHWLSTRSVSISNRRHDRGPEGFRNFSFSFGYLAESCCACTAAPAPLRLPRCACAPLSELCVLRCLLRHCVHCATALAAGSTPLRAPPWLQSAGYS